MLSIKSVILKNHDGCCRLNTLCGRIGGMAIGERKVIYNTERGHSPELWPHTYEGWSLVRVAIYEDHCIKNLSFFNFPQMMSRMIRDETYKSFIPR